jgi:hypothetical protein
MLSLVLLVIVVGNVVLWGYQMNQLDWERMQEKIDVISAATMASTWTQIPSQYALVGPTTLVSGSTTNLTADDGAYITFRSYYSGNVSTDFVDNLANVDGSADKGQHSSFAAEQSGPDSISDTLTEKNTAGGSASFGSISGSSYTTVSATQLYGSVFTSPSDAQGAAIQNITWYGRTGSGSGNSKAVLVQASTKTIVAVSNVVSVSTTAQERTNTFAAPPAISASASYILMMIFDVSTRLYYGSGSSNQGFYDASNNYAVPTNPSDSSSYNNYQYRIRASYNRANNYELDLEVQWTNVDYSQPNKMLCIYGGTMGSENIGVDVWNGSSWQNVLADLATGWNNVSVSSFLTSQTFTVKFKGGTEVSDTVQDSWNVDAALLRLWSDEYTSEVEFTGVSNTEAWTLMNWTTNTAWTTDSVAVTIQLYNFTSGSYQTSGIGYFAYVSSPTSNTDENAAQSTNAGATDFRDAAGYWKLKIKGVKSEAAQFDFKADFVQVFEEKRGTQLTLENEGSLTCHVISVWVVNSTQHQRITVDLYLNSGETSSQTYSNVNLPSGNYTVKVATERGNMAILQSG